MVKVENSDGENARSFIHSLVRLVAVLSLQQGHKFVSLLDAGLESVNVVKI